MKNLKKRFVLIALSILSLFGVFTFSPIIANAENDTNISEETITYPMCYLFSKSETTKLAVTLIDENTAKVQVFENNELNEEITADYTLDGDIITITVNGEIYGVYDRSLPFGANDDNNVTPEVPEDSDNTQTPDNVVTPEAPEDAENTQTSDNVLTEEQLEEVKGFIQNAYNKFKNKLLSIYLFLTGTTLGAVIACAGSIILKKCKKKIKEENTLTAEQIELIATNSATNVVKSIVGKSLNVDIQAEVSNSVKEEIAPIAKNMKIVMQSAKNAEMGTALVMKAQAKSRLISDEETSELETKANSLLAHAEKFGGLSAPIQISTEEKKEKKKQSTAVNLVETPNKPVEKKENESYITF